VQTQHHGYRSGRYPSGHNFLTAVLPPAHERIGWLSLRRYLVCVFRLHRRPHPLTFAITSHLQRRLLLGNGISINAVTMGRKPLTARQIMALQVSERSMSVLSILGSLFIITTFLRWHYFRKPINRLVFYASFGNIMANVATLIATSALPSSPDSFSSLCEFQGILIQWYVFLVGIK
jgi:hypothetical protein